MKYLIFFLSFSAFAADPLIEPQSYFDWPVLASTATFKVIVSGKKNRASSSGDNGDTWGIYQTEMNEILDYIATNSITGILWVAGDKHRPHVISESVSGGDTHDNYCICSCPIGVDLNAVMALDNGLVWQGDHRNVGLIHIYEDYIETVLIKSVDGKVIYRGRLDAGSNKETLPDLQVAI